MPPAGGTDPLGSVPPAGHLPQGPVPPARTALVSAAGTGAAPPTRTDPGQYRPWSVPPARVSATCTCRPWSVPPLVSTANQGGKVATTYRQPWRAVSPPRWARAGGQYRLLGVARPPALEGSAACPVGSTAGRPPHLGARPTALETMPPAGIATRGAVPMAHTSGQGGKADGPYLWPERQCRRQATACPYLRPVEQGRRHVPPASGARPTARTSGQWSSTACQYRQPGGKADDTYIRPGEQRPPAWGSSTAGPGQGRRPEPLARWARPTAGHRRHWGQGRRP
mgnify:FL=1